MKLFATTIAAALLTASFMQPAAAQSKEQVIRQVTAQCRAQAERRFLPIQFIKRRMFMRACVTEGGRRAQAQMQQKMKMMQQQKQQMMQQQRQQELEPLPGIGDGRDQSR